MVSVSVDLDLPVVLERIVAAAVDLVDARYGALGVLDDGKSELSQFITVGLDDETYRAIGELPKGHGILGLLIDDPKPIRLPSLSEHPNSYGFPPHHPPMQSFLGVPIRVRNEVFGNLYLTDKMTSEVFSDIDEELVVALAGAAGVAIENARLHARLGEMVLLEDRERIARDLHDTVIQRLFATGLSLQASVQLIQRPEAAQRVQAAVEELDDTVRQIRTAIFGLEQTRSSVQGLRHQVLTMGREATRALGFAPQMAFDGPVDTVVEEHTATELLATLREALSNIAHPAHAGRVEIWVEVNGEVILRVRDDGQGFADDDAGRGCGLRNMADRAQRLGGTLQIRPAEGGGTDLVWRVPAKLA